MAIIYSYPQISTVDPGDLLIITDISNPANPTRNVTVSQLAGAISISAYPNRYIFNGLVNNLASAAAGYDFMEWVGNVTPDTQIPLTRTCLQNLQLEMVTWVWCGDAALSIGVGEQVAFTIGSVASGLNAQIANYVSLAPLFSLTALDNGTFASGQLDLTGAGIIIPANTNIGVVGTEAGTVTPNDGELGIALQFRSV
tara:strand:- start:1542 stop:2135 length:594 start_codon:yes stop_codon:yes gene_type:complete